MEKDKSKVAGALARAKALDPETRAQIAKKAAMARWNSDLPKATHEGDLELAGSSIRCAVLEDGTRVLTESEFMRTMRMYRSGALSTRRRNETANGGAQIPLYLAFKNLRPFVDQHLSPVHDSHVKYRTTTGNIAHGITAELIPKICEIWMDARKAGVLGRRQQVVAEQAEIILRGLAHVGIAALVDEATGYQEVRDRKALQAILDRYLTDEWSKWTKTFPDEFYRHLFRLKGMSYPPMEGNRKPMYVGHWTNDIVYSRLAPGVLDELKRKNPSKSRGGRSRKHHQHLTKDFGHPELKEHLNNVMFLMSACNSWDTFKQMLDRAKPKHGDTIPLDL